MRSPFDAHSLGPQNGSGSSGPEKLLKIVNYATIKETKKLKETMVGFQVDLVGGRQYPPGSPPIANTWHPSNRLHEYQLVDKYYEGDFENI